MSILQLINLSNGYDSFECITCDSCLNNLFGCVGKTLTGEPKKISKSEMRWVMLA